jgi:tetrapyrrole methylase family protein/MazG family protein
LEKAVISSARDFEQLVELVERLRSDNGCPWDREQTAEQVKVYLLEEAYEVLDAMESERWEDVCGELGDLLFQILLMAKIFEEEEKFSIREVVQKTTEKMIRRHPHVFGTVRISCADEVKNQWHEIKMAEARDRDEANASFFDSVPEKLPALMRAYRLSERAARLGFKWPDVEAVLKKVDEELADFRAALEEGDTGASTDAFGDLMFSLTNLARMVRLHPETALAHSISRFVNRLRALERTLKQQGRSLESASFHEMKDIW